MYSSTAIEIIVSIIVVILCFCIVLFFSGRSRKVGFIVLSILVLGIISIFVIRPYFIDYHVNIKTTQLNQYLTNKYPNETWSIQRQVRKYQNPYHLEVVFTNEPEWTYIYKVIDQNKVILTSYSNISEQGSLKESKHLESFE